MKPPKMKWVKEECPSGNIRYSCVTTSGVKLGSVYCPKGYPRFCAEVVLFKTFGKDCDYVFHESVDGLQQAKKWVENSVRETFKQMEVN